MFGVHRTSLNTLLFPPSTTNYQDFISPLTQPQLRIFTSPSKEPLLSHNLAQHLEPNLAACMSKTPESYESTVVS